VFVLIVSSSVAVLAIPVFSLPPCYLVFLIRVLSTETTTKLTASFII